VHSTLRRSIAVAILIVLARAAAHATDLPLQLELTVPLATAGARQRFAAKIEPGDATLKGQVRGQRGGETARIDLTFRYRIPADTIAFDEIIDRIEITTEDTNGGVFGVATIDTAEINLNPNRVPLSYRVTLYHPGAPYVVRVRVFGNYE